MEGFMHRPAAVTPRLRSNAMKALAPAIVVGTALRVEVQARPTAYPQLASIE